MASSKFQFSMAFALAMVTFVAFACAALVNSLPIWTNIALTMTLMVLLVSAVCAVFRSSSNRAFWTGVAVFGWVYLILIFWPEYEQNDFYQRRVSDHLLTTTLTEFVYERAFLPMHESREDTASESQGSGGGFAMAFGFGSGSSGSAGGGGWVSDDPDLVHSNFMISAHCFWSLAIALGGGIVSRALYLSKAPKT